MGSAAKKTSGSIPGTLVCHKWALSVVVMDEEASWNALRGAQVTWLNLTGLFILSSSMRVLSSVAVMTRNCR